jgi:hypothetical protein
LAPLEFGVLQEIWSRSSDLVARCRADAGSILTLVASVAISAARDAATRVHPQLPEVARALQNQNQSDFPVLRQVIATREIQAPLERDFEFDLRVIIAGLERLRTLKQ